MNVGIHTNGSRPCALQRRRCLRRSRPGFDAPEAAFNAALLREQYRSLARLGPYVHGVVIVAALALFGATPTGSLLTGILLPTALIAVSVFRLVFVVQGARRRGA